MTATPESLLDEVMRAANDYRQERGPLRINAAEKQLRKKVEAYGRACRIAELRKVEDGGCLCGAVDPEYVCVVHQRLAELEQEGG